MSILKLRPTKSIAQRVAARLRLAITEGEFPPGSNIPEEKLAQSFGVSRTPIREALNQLQLQGLVVIRPQVGSFVFSPDPADIDMLCEFRLVMEPWAARLAYNRDPVGTRGVLEKVLENMEAAAEVKDHLAYARCDTLFHETFVERCGNQYVQEAYKVVAGRIAALRTNYSAPIDIKSKRALIDHQEMLNLFAAGNLEGFERLANEHVTATAAYLREIIERAAAETDGSR